jgi:hypothetical protein
MFQQVIAIIRGVEGLSEATQDICIFLFLLLNNCMLRYIQQHYMI